MGLGGVNTPKKPAHGWFFGRSVRATRHAVELRSEEETRSDFIGRGSRTMSQLLLA